MSYYDPNDLSDELADLEAAVERLDHAVDGFEQAVESGVPIETPVPATDIVEIGTVFTDPAPASTDIVEIGTVFTDPAPASTDIVEIGTVLAEPEPTSPDVIEIGTVLAEPGPDVIELTGPDVIGPGHPLYIDPRLFDPDYVQPGSPIWIQEQLAATDDPDERDALIAQAINDQVAANQISNPYDTPPHLGTPWVQP